jgi:N-acetylmuramoyl-L-alanine amidase
VGSRFRRLGAAIAAALVLAWLIRPGPLQPSPPPAAARQLPLSGLTIVVDPGHGGIDSGAIARGVAEKAINLAVSQATAREMTGLGARVVMTRGGDRAPVPRGHQRYLRDRRRRADLVAESGAQVFVSIHANYNGSSQPHGAVVLWNPAGSPGGRALAGAIRTALARELQAKVAIARQSVAVLQWAGVPAALVEVGFLSNPRDRAILQNPAYQVRLGTAVAAGVRAYWSARRAEETFRRGIAWAP